MADTDERDRYIPTLIKPSAEAMEFARGVIDWGGAVFSVTSLAGRLEEFARATLTRAVERRREAEASVALLHKALKKHHDRHLQSGMVGLPDGNGNWIEIDDALEYSESTLCSETETALANTNALILHHAKVKT